MKQEVYTPISVTEPVTKAIESVKLILFRPFNMRKWFVIGFCAWLACWKASGGPQPKMYNNSPHGNGFHFNGNGFFNQEMFKNEISKAMEYLGSNFFWIVPAACIAIATVLLLWLVLTWLSSRGHFMFLHCVAGNKAEVQAPWTQFKQHGNSLFLFRIILDMIFFATIAVCLVFTVICGIALSDCPPGPALVFSAVGLAAGILCTISSSVVFFFIKKFTVDFVVPIMFLQTARCLDGWRVFRHTMFARKGALVMYLLFYLVITIALGAITLTAILLTCCCAGIIMVIPYIGVVFMLPLIVFKRAYSLHFLGQFGAEYDVFANRIKSGEESIQYPL